MGISVSLVLIAIGAVLTWAVTATTSGIDINTVGVILMIVGAAGLVLSLDLLVELGRFRQRSGHDDRRARRRTTPLSDRRCGVGPEAGPALRAPEWRR